MNLKDREKEIFDILFEKGRMSVAELASKLYVSEMTIRRDLDGMEKKGILHRYRGGAVLNPIDSGMPISQRYFVDEEEKKQLAKICLKHLEDNLVVYIDSSSTCQYIIPYIAKFDNILLITNSVNALLSTSKMQIPCILIGGEYYGADMCFVGAVAEEYARRYNPDVAFFSSAAIDEEGVITDLDVEQASIRKIIMKNSKKNIYLFEKSKIGKKYFYTLCSENDVDEVIRAE